MRPRARTRRTRAAVPRLLGSLLLIATAGAVAVSPATAQPRPAKEPTALDQIIPAPTSAKPKGEPFTLNRSSHIQVSIEAHDVGEKLAQLLRPSTGFKLPVTSDGHNRDTGKHIRLVLDEDGAKTKGLGKEGYRLTSSPEELTITAPKVAGLFYGTQTLRQLLPASVESREEQTGPWQVAGGTITDSPRYEYRSAMLDVSRHFLSVNQVKRYIDHMALYKFNKLHLHLSDDQGWRIAIDSWPRLTEYGGSTQVGGGEGGHYTKDQYRELLKYAAERQLEVVPEIDMPGHTNAALASYAELNCDGKAPPLYTGIEVGFSSLCVDKDVTYDFVDDVVREIAELTPGKYLHIGGDEAHATEHEDYVAFMDKAQATVAKYGKTVVGWHQLTGAKPAKGAVAQYWGTEANEKEVIDAAKKGTKLLLSPANRVYLDMKYDESTPIGLSWAGYVDTEQSYSWEPGSFLKGAPADSVIGVEAPMWTETISTNAHMDLMAFPRLPGAAELGWSAKKALGWDGYKQRLAAQGPRWDALGIGYHPASEVPWPDR
ncbi:beta-N-acetylhexosaminidase [Streptomyces sp. NPDC005438]|uniref:beta-N-acetylhexosaminidase n=1 Tax=Streptomyces sp. NPDC005438 TaxID=3156880 RepID=UPI0033BF5262